MGIETPVIDLANQEVDGNVVHGPRFMPIANHSHLSGFYKLDKAGCSKCGYTLSTRKSPHLLFSDSYFDTDNKLAKLFFR